MNKKDTKPRKGLLIGLLVLLLIASGVGIGAWVLANTPTNDTSTTTALPAPQVIVPEDTPEPEPEPQGRFVRDSFCDEFGQLDTPSYSRFTTLVDFTTATSIDAPVEMGLGTSDIFGSSGRVGLVDGCSPTEYQPEVTFTPVDVSGDQCTRTHPAAVQDCRKIYPQYAEPYIVSLQPEWVFYEDEIPSWLGDKLMYEVATSYGIDPGDGFSYVIPVSAGEWDMTVTYEGETHTIRITIPQMDASSQVFEIQDSGRVRIEG